MSADTHVDSCLRAIRALTDALVDEILALSPDAWDGPTNCPPWRVRDIAAHLTSSAEAFVESVRRGLAGSVEPPDGERRARRQAELEAADPTTVARALQAATITFIRLYDDLDDGELSAICFHRRGNRSVRWYAVHRLSEVAFHGWDLQLSLGNAPVLAESVAALVLPTLLESNVPRTYAAGLTPERGSGERFGLVVVGDPSARWLVTIDADELVVQRGSALCDLTITGSAADLALLAYGRRELRDLAAANAVHLEGDAALVDRFPLIFPRP